MTDAGDRSSTSERRPSLVTIAKMAYSSPYRVVGNLIAAVSLFNLSVAVFRMQPAQLLASLLAAYRFIFHSIIEVVLVWWPWPLSSIVKDAIVLWALIGTTIIRWMRAVGLHNPPHTDTFWWRVYAVFYYAYFLVVTMLLGPLVLVIYFSARDPISTFFRLYLNRPQKVFFPPIRLLMGLKEPPFEKRLNALVLLLMFLVTLAACGVLIATSAFFGHPGALPEG
jgi:hypothetical protein